jgi:hypothetical protein
VVDNPGEGYDHANVLIYGEGNNARAECKIENNGSIDSVQKVLSIFSRGFISLDNDSEGIVIFGHSGSASSYIYHVEDADVTDGFQLKVTPIGGLSQPAASMLTAENITARPPQPDYISIGRFDADQTAFDAWFDTDEDGVYDAGEELLGLDFYIDEINMTYAYSIRGIDFAEGSYTVRLVDVITFATIDLFDLVRPYPGGDYSQIGGHLDLVSMGFGKDDKVIIDMNTNSADWMGLVVDRDPSIELLTPTRSLGNNTVGDYGDMGNMYGPTVSTGLFGQLINGIRPSDNQSKQEYARFDIFVENASSTQVSWEAMRYVPPTTLPDGGRDAMDGLLIDLGVPVTAQNLEFILPTFIA